MDLKEACRNILQQLGDVVRQINDHDYTQPAVSLSRATVGQHLRHTLEFFTCLESGYQPGIVNYDKRAHDQLIEQDREVALGVLARVESFIDEKEKDKVLQLEVGYDLNQENFVTVSTNYLRELVYNIEHAVHHMALIKIGLREVAPYVELPSNFGVAASSVRYQGSISKAD